MAKAKTKNEVKQDPDAAPEVPLPEDGIQPGSTVRDATVPDEKPDPASVAQVEEVKEFPPTEAA